MCLAVPGKVESISENGLVRMGKVNFGGVVKDICLEYVPEIGVGDYALVHVGFAIGVVDEKSAQETLKLFAEMGLLDEELGPPDAGSSAEPERQRAGSSANAGIDSTSGGSGIDSKDS